MRKLIEFLTRDFYGKVAAFAIAIALYLYLGSITTGQVEKRFLLVRASDAEASREENRIEIEEPPNTIVLLDPGTFVALSLEGEQSRIEQITLKPLVGRVPAQFLSRFAPLAGEGRREVAIPASAIEYNVSWAANLVHPFESPITITLAQKERRLVTAEPKVIGRPAAGFRVRGVYATPSRVEVEGPADQLRVKAVQLAPISIEELNSNFTVHGRLEPIPSQADLILREEVTVLVQIEPSPATRELALPLAILLPEGSGMTAADGAIGSEATKGRDQFAAKGGSLVRVTFDGPAEALDQISPASVRVFVDIGAWPSEATVEAALPIHVIGLPPGVGVVPQRVAVVRIAASESARTTPRREGAGE